MILPRLWPLPPAGDLVAAVDALADSEELGSGYALGWLTRLVARTAGEEEWEEAATAAGRLLARLTGDQASRTALDRRYAFGEVEVVIRDAPDMSYSSIGAQTWNAAPLLAQRIHDRPADFFPTLFSPPRPALELAGIETPPYTRPSTPTRRPYRILELGSGTGLVGIATAALLARLPVEADVELVLTDYHPDVLANLRHNVEANGCRGVDVVELDWRDPDSSQVRGRFDAILGSDVVYEPQHAYLVAGMVRRYLAPSPEVIGPTPRRPAWPLTPEPSRPGTPLPAPFSTPTTLFHLVLPLRPTFVQETQAVLDAFGGSATASTFSSPSHDSSWQDVKSAPRRPLDRPVRDLCIVHTDTATPDSSPTGQGVSDYQYICISWA